MRSMYVTVTLPPDEWGLRVHALESPPHDLKTHRHPEFRIGKDDLLGRRRVHRERLDLLGDLGIVGAQGAP